jgi:hypothetical protein
MSVNEIGWLLTVLTAAIFLTVVGMIIYRLRK